MPVYNVGTATRSDPRGENTDKVRENEARSRKLNHNRLTCQLSWWLRSKESAFNARDEGLTPGSFPGKKQQPTLVFSPGKFREQRSLEDYSPWGHKRVRRNLATKQ